MKKLLIILAALLCTAWLALVVSGHGYILTAVSRTYFAGHPTANIDDHNVFATRIIAAGTPQQWTKHPDYPVSLPAPLASAVPADDGVALLVIRDGQLIAEQYFAGYDEASRTNSFSMAKTVVTMLLGFAIEDGLITGFDEPLTTLLPEFDDDDNARQATLGSLSTMTSGYEWDEHYYSPFSPTVQLLYGDDVESFVLDGEFTRAPESYFYYSSASTQLLGIALSRALHKRDPDTTLSDYLSEKLWRPLGMNADALWHLDERGMELVYCCISTNARNYAKLGQLMLDNGNWQGRQLLPAGFVDAMRTPRATPYYGYSTWLTYDHATPYYAFNGHLGQFIIVVPSEELVIVRLGRSIGDEQRSPEQIIAGYVDQVVAMLPARPSGITAD